MSKFPTGKPHISFSEIKLWKECSFRHKLTYIDKLDAYEDNPYADFGTAVHNTIEAYLLSKKMNLELFKTELTTKWNKGGYDSEEFALKMKDVSWWKGHKYPRWEDYGLRILNQFEIWINSNPEWESWECINAELDLYEQIEDTELKFKGFVDAVLRVKNKKGKELIYVIDWKTTGAGGWNGFKQSNGRFYSKKKDFTYLAQIGFYKKYVSKKLNIPLKDIRCAFVFLKRGTSQEKSIELFKVSAGPKFIEKTDKLVKNMVKSVSKGMFLKNFENCKYCPFANTEHCNGHKEW